MILVGNSNDGKTIVVRNRSNKKWLFSFIRIYAQEHSVGTLKKEVGLGNLKLNAPDAVL